MQFPSWLPLRGEDKGRGRGLSGKYRRGCPPPPVNIPHWIPASSIALTPGKHTLVSNFWYLGKLFFFLKIPSCIICLKTSELNLAEHWLYLIELKVRMIHISLLNVMREAPWRRWNYPSVPRKKCEMLEEKGGFEVYGYETCLSMTTFGPPWPPLWPQSWPPSWPPRLEICRDRRDRRSCKIFVSCVNFSRKQRSFLHILQVYTHLNVNFLHNC